jgi:hypothetical protein
LAKLEKLDPSFSRQAYHKALSKTPSEKRSVSGSAAGMGDVLWNLPDASTDVVVGIGGNINRCF